MSFCFSSHMNRKLLLLLNVTKAGVIFQILLISFSGMMTKQIKGSASYRLGIICTNYWGFNLKCVDFYGTLFFLFFLFLFLFLMNRQFKKPKREFLGMCNKPNGLVHIPNSKQQEIAVCCPVCLLQE